MRTKAVDGSSGESKAMLGRHERIVVDTLLPAHAHPELPLGVVDTGLDEFFAEFQRDASRPFRVNVRIALWVAVWMSPLLVRRAPPLSRLDRATRERALHAMYASRFPILRQLLSLLKAFSAICYGADRRVRSTVGYPGNNASSESRPS